MAVDLREAFQEFNMLNEDTFTIDDNGIAELKAFEIEDAKAPETETVIDPLAETEKDLEDSYMGNVILECDICKSKIFKKPEEVVINEEDNLANESEECPYCFTPGGFKVIGQVTEYCPHCDDVKVKVEDKEEESTKLDNIDADADDEKEKAKSDYKKESDDADADRDYKLNMNEALDSELKRKARLGFNKAKHYLEKKYPYIDVGSLFIDESEISAENEEGSMTFSILPEDMNLEKALTLMANPNNYVWFGPDALNDEKLSNQWSYMNLDDDYIKKYPKAYNVMENAGLHLVGDPYIKDVEPEFLIKVNLNAHIDRDDKKENLKEEIENISIETKDQKISVTSEDKECGSEKEEMIEAVDSETEEKFKDIDIDEFDEESFDTLGENYLKKVYDNVESFRTSQGRISDNKLILEGIITFKSGKQGKTSFIFEARSCNKEGKVKFLGENKQFAKGDKAFTIEGNISNKKLIVENFRYNYRAKDANGESKHVYGNIRK